MIKKNIGIIGCGNISIEYLKVLQKIKSFNVYGITSKTNKNCNKVAKQFSINKVFRNYLELASDTNIDIILVLVSYKSIYDVCSKIIKFQKPFFLEKPPGLSLSQAKHLSLLSYKFKVKNMIGLNRRYYSIFEKGKKYSYSEMWYPTVEELINNNFITSVVSLASSSLRNLEKELNKSYKIMSESLPIKLDEITDLTEIKIELNIVKLIHDLNLDESGFQLLLNNMKIKEIPIPTFYGDEISYVNGLKYATQITLETILAKLFLKGIFYSDKYVTINKIKKKKIFTSR